jgi:flagellar motility protein MotE (MotC chaperone)
MEGVSMKIETIVCGSKEEAIKKISEIFDEAEAKKNMAEDDGYDDKWVQEKLKKTGEVIEDGNILNILAVLGITLAKVINQCLKPRAHGDVLGMFMEKVIAQLAGYQAMRDKENETDGDTPVDGDKDEGIGNTNIH